MQNEGYRIGEASRITGISKDTLHFYIKSGLLTPDYTDPGNHYAYFSRWNMYQLDIIMACRSLGVPLAQVRQILRSKDNRKVVALLEEYRQEALRLAEYYRQVAEDIDWYRQADENIQLHADDTAVHLEHRESETVLAGKAAADGYHASLQGAIKQEMQGRHFIRRTYGYFLSGDAFAQNRLEKYREYIRLPEGDYSGILPEHLAVLPGGDYAVFTACIRDEQTDFAPLLAWLRENRRETDLVLAEELGFQLFQYIHEYYCRILVHLIG